MSIAAVRYLYLMRLFRAWLQGLLLLITLPIAAQDRMRFLEGQVGLIQPSYPLSEMGELFQKPFHSQYLAGMCWQKTGSHRLNLTYGLRTGLLYHRFIQWGIPVQGHIGGTMALYKRLGLEGNAMGGYLHSFPLTQTYRMKDGRYERTGRLGRPQAQLGLEVGPSFRVDNAGHTLFLHYQFWLQLPFINSYVPALPYNGLAVGFRWAASNKAKAQ